MNKNDKASGSLIKILVISLVIIFATGIGVTASNAKFVNVKIILSNGYEMSVLTTKTKVSDILDENHIVLDAEENVYPKLYEEISDNKTIRISYEEINYTEVAEEETIITKEEILNAYGTIVEKLITEQETIPYETITKEASGEGTKVNKVVQNGRDGLKEVTYKVKYQNDEEIERVEISSEIIREPVDKIVEVNTVLVSSRGGAERAVTGSIAEYQDYAKQRCEDYGWDEDDFDCLVLLWYRESGWRVTAQNKSSGAYGIPQSLPASKMGAFGDDYLTNYKTQIEWGLSYINGRYGSPSAAWAHSQRKGWY